MRRPKIAPSFGLAMSLLLLVCKMIFNLIQISLSYEHFRRHRFSRLWFKGHSQCQHFSNVQTLRQQRVNKHRTLFMKFGQNYHYSLHR